MSTHLWLALFHLTAAVRQKRSSSPCLKAELEDLSWQGRAHAQGRISRTMERPSLRSLYLGAYGFLVQER